MCVCVFVCVRFVVHLCVSCVAYICTCVCAHTNAYRSYVLFNLLQVYIYDPFYALWYQLVVLITLEGSGY